MRYSWLFRHKILREGIFNSIRDLCPQEQQLVLDVGCGKKRYRDLFRGAKYFGIDLPFSNSEGNRADVYGSALALPFRDKTFDCVISTEVIEHVPDPVVFLSQVSKVLALEGCLLLSAPFFWPLHEEPYDFYRFTIHGLRELLRKQGFTVKEVIKRGGFASVMVQLAGDYFKTKNKMINTITDVVFGILQVAAVWFDSIFPTEKYATGWTIKAIKNENSPHQ
ncbi:MAG: class I SAM-dependent methyltransferase [Fibrobacter sp.]|nr:class I SAM-dependent methyltransferase [Fibrobacter sp.]